MARRLALGLLAAVPVAVVAVFFVLPVGAMLHRGVWPEGAFDPGAVLDVLRRPRTARVLWFTVWTSSVATALAVLLGLPAAYVVHRLRFPGRALVRTALLVPFVLPTVVVGLAVRELIAASGTLGFLDLDGTPVAILIGLVFFNVAVVIRTVGVAWEGLDRRPAEAAAALGATPVQVLRTVTLPALRPAIVSAASVVFLFCATAFGVVLVLGGVRYSSVETEIYLLTADLLDLPAAAALSLVQMLAVVALLVVVGRLRAVPDPTVRRVAAPPARPRPRDVPALAVTVLTLALVSVPVLTLAVGSVRREGRWSLDFYRALGGSADGLLQVSVTDALAASLRIAVDATWMSLALGLVVAFVVTRRVRTRAGRRARAVLDGFFMLPLGVSAVTLGFGFLIALDQPPLDLRASPLLVPIAQALVALPLVVRTLVPVLAGIDDRQRQAAASLGAGPLRTLLSVDLAVVWRPLLAAAGFAFAVSLGEFGATSFIVRPAEPTLPVVIYRLLGHPGALNYGTAMAASVVLAAVTAGVILVVERLRVPGVGSW
ncbi:ABC transporter permease [Nocardioides daeguensis]|uniref:Iron ABC transporter permease n=1 Tax=Nocardioides daeguensis TaxID=908359 RepID=A0ABP6UQE3_9ACTN|nr:ABC transporter permease subunit [Nocardioides daeguensis]MBV6728638.1 ABC transporter permease subunit [Nocardioides daeguensis]MCR1773753.1 ABC transporter permease subunit [Nocardioides daeguensis]